MKLCFVAYLLLGIAGCVSRDSSQTALNWGDTKSAGANLRKQILRVCDRTNQDATLAFQPIRHFEFELILPTDARYKASQQAEKDTDIVFNAAACAAFSDNASQATFALKRAQDGLQQWVNTYQPEGNPINDNRAIEFLQAADILKSKLDASLNHSLQQWARRFIKMGDNFYAGKIATSERDMSRPDRDLRFKNNWHTWRLAIRGTAAVYLRDEAEIQKTKQLVNTLLPINLNLDGSSFDFHHRDALHYHVYNLEAWTILLTTMPPTFFTTVQKESIEQAFLFLKPYYLGDKIHLEFARSQVDFDKQRRDAGVAHFQNQPWKPERAAKRLLRIARCTFPSLQSWTQELDRNESEFSPRIKLLAALYCEAQ